MTSRSKAGLPTCVAAIALAACAPRTSQLGALDAAPPPATDAASDGPPDAASDGAADQVADASPDLGPRCVPGGTSVDLPVTVGCAQAPLGRLVVAGDYLYWTVQAAGPMLLRAPLAGGDAQALVSDFAGAFGLVVDDTFVYYAQPGPGRIMRVPLAGNTAPVMLTEAEQPLLLASDGKSLYWTGGRAGGDGRVMKLDLAPGAVPVTLIDGQSQPRAIAVRDGFVYWTDIMDGTILRTQDHLLGPADAGVRSASRLASGLKIPADLLLIGAFAYVPDRAGHIRRVPIEGGDLETVADVDGMPYSVATDGASLFWSVLGPGGAIFTGPLTPVPAGKGTLVIGDQPDPHFVAATADNVYWGTWGAYPAVHRLAR